MIASDPFVSVVMAARNNESFVAAAVDSVLTQDYDRLELIAVDDASDDATAEVLAQCASDAPPGRMRLVRRDRRRGIAETRADALHLARGGLIAVLDSDDLWLPGKLGPQVELLRNRPDVGVVHAEFEVFDSDSGATIPWAPRCWDRDADPLLELVRLGCFVATGTSLIRRSAIAQRNLGFVNPAHRSYDDYLLFLTIALDWGFAHEDRVVLRYRRHVGNITNVTYADNLPRARANLIDYFVTRFPEARARLGSELRRTLARQLVTAAAIERRRSYERAARWTLAAFRQQPAVALGTTARLLGDKVSRTLAAS